MSIFRRNGLISSPSAFSRLQTLVFKLQRWNHTTAGEGGGVTQCGEPSAVGPAKGHIDTTTWKTVDSRALGINNAAISSSTWLVLKILHREGFEAYLVGGCVRDLILKRAPKDFDVVTTASLRQIKRKFRRCLIVGRMFPICQVHISGSIVEVSSFQTTHINAMKREAVDFSEMPNTCSNKDFVLWKDSMRRDFTINGLFYDPLVYTIFDYVDGIEDIMASKVRTVIPAHLSFTEDCARILRGLRIVARLGLRFSKDTATAVQDLSSSIMTLGKQRLMMELNFMLAYGAAESSISLLHKYKLLDFLLPLHAAYLNDQIKKQSSGSSIMLMKLFSHADKLLAADRPSSHKLWLGLLAFHLALIKHPQNALVVWTLSSILYLGTWSKAISFVRENVIGHVQFVPELLDFCGTKSDELLLEDGNESLMKETSRLASMIVSSVDALTGEEALEEAFTRYQVTRPCTDLGHLVLPDRVRKNMIRIFNVLESDIKSYSQERETLEVNYERLKKGDPDEIRFVLGKVIFDTMNNELASPIIQKATEQTKDDKFIHSQSQDRTAVKRIHHTQPASQENHRKKINDELISFMTTVAKKVTPNTLEETMSGELNHWQSEDDTSENAIISSLHIKEDNIHTVLDSGSDDLTQQQYQGESFVKNTYRPLSMIFRQNQSVASMKKIHPTNGELAEQQNQKSAEVKKRSRPLSSLFR